MWGCTTACWPLLKPCSPTTATRRQELPARGQHHPEPDALRAVSYERRRGCHCSTGCLGIGVCSVRPWAVLTSLEDERTRRHVFIRRKNQDFVEGEIAAWTREHTKQEVVDALGGRVPCGPINTAADIFADPHVKARDMIEEFDLPGDNPRVAIVGSPIKYTDTPTGLYRRPPMHGEHTEEVLAEFGITRPGE